MNVPKDIVSSLIAVKHYTIKRSITVLMYDENLVKKYWAKWVQEGINIDFEEYIQCCQRIKHITKSTKYRNFQYCVVLGKIVTNVDLFEWKISQVDLCGFCGQTKESIVHIFVQCEKLTKIIKWV